MRNTKPVALSKQAMAVYRSLLKEGELTAVDVGRRFGIVPNGVYRLVEKLEKLGLVERIKGRPVKFRARSASEGLGAYLVNQRGWFSESFLGDDNRERLADVNGRSLKVGFIQSRKEFLDEALEDLKKAQVSVDVIVSGDEVPAEVILEFKRAKERGVRLRMLTQQLNESNKEMLVNRKKMGTDVRYIERVDARVLIFDSRVLYLVSYDPNDKEVCVGVGLDYGPITRLVEGVFEAKWARSKKI